MTTHKNTVSSFKATDDIREAGRGVGGDSNESRKPFVAPRMDRHEKLPVMTAGSISSNSWGY